MGQQMRTANPISPSKGITIAVVVGCAIAVATTALLPSTELSITDSCQIDGPIQKLMSALQGQRYWVKQLQLLDEPQPLVPFQQALHHQDEPDHVQYEPQYVECHDHRASFSALARIVAAI